MCFDLAEKCAIVFHTSNSVEITTSTLLGQLIFHHEDSVHDPQTLSSSLGNRSIAGSYRLVWATAKTIATSYILYFENK